MSFMSDKKGVLELQNVSYQVQGKTLLASISARFLPGQLTVIIGPNGAGKSTLLKLACGELKPHIGKVLWQGRALTEFSFSELARQRAVLEQHNPLEFNFRVEEVVALARMPHASGADYDQALVQQCLQQMDIQHLSQAYYPSLSGGEKQRVQLARALAQVQSLNEPTPLQQAILLVLDEPVAALDLFHQQGLLQLLKNKAQAGYCVVLVLHDLNLASQYADQVLLLKQGHLLASGSVNEVMQPAGLSEVFGLPFHCLSHPLNGQRVFVH